MKIVLLLLYLSIALTALAQGPESAELAEMEGGRRVLEYFRSFNSGDEQKLRGFFEANVTSESLKQRPVEPRLEFHREIRKDYGTLEIKKVVSIEIGDAVEVELLVQGGNGGWLSYSFRFERQSPQKLLGWQIRQTEATTEEVSSPENAPKSETELLAAVNRYLNELVSDDKFSGTVLIASGSRPIFQKAYGWAEKEAKKTNNLKTKFNLGSMNKAFTRIVIGQLVKQGKISYDDKLGKYLPDNPNKEASEKVTIRHLSTMRSGIGDFFGEKYDAAPKGKLRTISDFIPLFADQPLAFEPGTKSQYSNGGYILLGAIIEKVTGMSYYDYVRKHLFQPARMADTDYYESDKKTANMAEGYTTLGVSEGSAIRRRNNRDTRPARGTSAGGGYSTIGDLLKFSLLLRNGTIQLPDESQDPKNSNRKFAGFGIAGGSPGVNAIMEISPENGYTVIVLSNYDPPYAEKVGTTILNWLRRIKN
jgi:CubicO group peptidase (beta-lactamase class C family)